MKLAVSVAMLAALAAGSVAAQEQEKQPGSLSLKTVVQKVVEVRDPAGEVRTELVPAEVAVPGDAVVYTVTFTNVGAEAAENVLITNPIPPQMRYEAGTAFGPGTAIEYSADGGVNYSSPQSLFVADADGGQRVARAEEYTHIRWQLNNPLEPGAQGMARFRAVVR